MILPANIDPKSVLWAPHEGAQERFLRSSVREVLYGGAAGGGKSDCLLADALGGIHHKRYSGIIFRRTFPLLVELIERAKLIYPAAGGEYNGGSHLWRFPSGARIQFSHMQHVDNRLDHKSAEYQYIGFDELTSFEELQYVYLFSRGRTSTGIPVQVRAATNPGDRGHEWVLKRWAPWLLTEPRPDLVPGFTGPFVESGTPLWSRPGDDGVDRFYDRPIEGATSRTFISARIEDNPSIDKEYRNALRQLDPVTRRQLEFGNWLIKPAAGAYFKASWCEYGGAAPPDAKRIRYWDLAGTAKKEGSKADPDWTVGARLAEKGGRIWVEDIERFRDSPGNVEARMLETARRDGPSVMIGLEQDPGQAGKYQIERLVRLFRGHTVKVCKPDTDKISRFGPFSSYAEPQTGNPHGNVVICHGQWNRPYTDELEAFPEGSHDDQVDATSGAFRVLCPAMSSKPKTGTGGFGWY